MTFVIKGQLVPTEMSVSEQALIQEAGGHDEGMNRPEDWCRNVVAGCVKGAKLAERIAKELRDTAQFTAEEDDLSASKEVLDELLSYVDVLRVVVTAARWRREIPADLGRIDTLDQLVSLVRDLSHY
jgi:hypothetical protein